jgi:hypothetical protein
LLGDVLATQLLPVIPPRKSAIQILGSNPRNPDRALTNPASSPYPPALASAALPLWVNTALTASTCLRSTAEP